MSFSVEHVQKKISHSKEECCRYKNIGTQATFGNLNMAYLLNFIVLITFCFKSIPD